MAILLFLALGVGGINRMAGRGFVGSNMIVIPCVALLLLLTVGFLLIPPAFVGSAIYNFVALVVLICLMVEYISTHTEWSHRAMGITYLLGFGAVYIICPPSLVFDRLAPPFGTRPIAGAGAIVLSSIPRCVGLGRLII